MDEDLLFLASLEQMIAAQQSKVVEVRFNDFEHLKLPPLSEYDGHQDIFIKYIPEPTNTISPNWYVI